MSAGSGPYERLPFILHMHPNDFRRPVIGLALRGQDAGVGGLCLSESVTKSVQLPPVSPGSRRRKNLNDLA